MQRKLPLLACLFLSTVMMASCASGITSDEKEQGITHGQASAPVEMVVYFDYKCPDCKAFHDDILQQVENGYVADGRLKIHFRDFPLLPDSNLSHNAAWCAREVGEDAHRQYMAKLFANQSAQRLFQLKAYGTELGFPESFKTCIEEGRYLDLVNDFKTKGRTESVSRTPTIVIGGERYNNATGLFDIINVIETQLKK